MTIEEMKQHEWFVAWSGGKDSTATIILMHENEIPIKEIMYCRMMYDDTLPATLPVMTDFVDHAREVFESWGYKVRYIYPKRNLMQLASRVYRRSKYEIRNGHYYGITALCRAMCNMTYEKQCAVERNLPSDDEYQMIGYAADETSRLHRLTDHKCSIMVELGIKEKDTFDICREYNLLSPLYDLGIKRDGCWFCPNAAKREREYLKEHYPELVQKIDELIDMCDYDLSAFANSGRNHWMTDRLESNQNFLHRKSLDSEHGKE